MFAFGAALLQVNVVVAVAINLVAVVGSAPTVWRWRATPVWRWVVYGLAAGVALAWIGLFFDATGLGVRDALPSLSTHCGPDAARMEQESGSHTRNRSTATSAALDTEPLPSRLGGEHLGVERQRLRRGIHAQRVLDRCSPAQKPRSHTAGRPVSSMMCTRVALNERRTTARSQVANAPHARTGPTGRVVGAFGEGGPDPGERGGGRPREDEPVPRHDRHPREAPDPDLPRREVGERPVPRGDDVLIGKHPPRQRLS